MTYSSLEIAQILVDTKGHSHEIPELDTFFLTKICLFNNLLISYP